jgi:hypothetical protein
MPTIANLEDLLPLLGSVAMADDPIAALEQRGHRLSPGLQARLEGRRAPSPAQLARGRRAVARAGALTVSTGPLPSFHSRELAPGEFEFSAGLRVSAANEILAGLHANGTIPDVIFLDELLAPGTLELLEGAFIVDRPGGRIGRFQITAPPTIAPIQDGFDRVAFTIPFRLNFERVRRVLSTQLRTVVTFATGRLRLVVGLATRTVPVSIAARNLEIQVDLSSSDEARLELDPDSPVQRRSPPDPGEADGLAIILQNALQQRLASSLRVTISAAIPLPIGKLEIRDTALITRGDALLVGIKVQGTPGAGDPETLTALFPNAETNFFTRVHDEVLRLIVRSAARSGELTRIAKETHPDAVIDSADVAFGNDTIEVRATGKIVDLCPLGVDLGFTVTTTLRITLEGTRIRVRKSTEENLDNLDAVVCTITTLGLALLAAVAVIVTQGVGLASGFAATYALGVVGVLTVMLAFESEDFDLVLSDSGDEEPTFIELDFPITGTDLLPTLTGMFIRLDESTMLMAAQLGLRPDVINTYFYVRFLEADNLGIARAMKGAQVRLMDRDSPAPAGDDVTLPGPSTTTSGQSTPAGDFAITRRTHYERTADEIVREATTDHTGRVRIYVPHDELASQAGSKVVETTRVNLDTEEETTSTRRTPVFEAHPDYYFRVTRPGGTALETLELPRGFFLNFESARVGTPANPLVIALGGGLVVGGGGVLVINPIRD